MSRFQPSPFSRVQPLDYGVQAGSPTLAAFFNTVYAWMTAGLALTAIVAWWVSHNAQAMSEVFTKPVLIVSVVVELGLVLVISAAVRRINATAATMLFLLFAAINGLTLSAVFIVYPIATIASAFVASAAMFGALSVYGMLTKRDLSVIGRCAFMLLIGLIVATFLGYFLHSPGFTWLLTYAGVGIFAVLTAWDTQRLSQIALSTSGDAALSKRLAISGALMLYLDFINLFVYMLQIMGNRRR